MCPGPAPQPPRPLPGLAYARRMRRLARLAAHTPPDRERYLDLLRAVAIILVVLGHWAISAVEYDESGRPDGHSALTTMPWAYPLTWAVQVMPVFFLVGGYANAASLAAHRSRGGDAIGWLLGRSALAGGALVARLGGAQPDEVRPVVWFATIPLWFLAAYLAVVPLTPVMYALHRRLGLLVPLALVLLGPAWPCPATCSAGSPSTSSDSPGTTPARDTAARAAHAPAACRCPAGPRLPCSSAVSAWRSCSPALARTRSA